MFLAALHQQFRDITFGVGQEEQTPCAGHVTDDQAEDQDDTIRQASAEAAHQEEATDDLEEGKG